MDAKSLKDLVDGNNEWLNIQEVIRQSFRALSDSVDNHKIHIERVEMAMSEQSNAVRRTTDATNDKFMEIQQTLARFENMIGKQNLLIQDLSSRLDRKQEQTAADESFVDLRRYLDAQLDHVLVQLKSKADLKILAEQLDVKADKAETRNWVDQVASSRVSQAEYAVVSNYVDEIKSKIAELTDVWRVIDAKSDRVEVQNIVRSLEVEIANRANIADVNKVLAEKSDKVEMLSLLNQKADANDVMSLIEKKADIHSVNECLERKANKETVAQALHRKANKVDVESMVATRLPTEEARILFAESNRRMDACNEQLERKSDKRAVQEWISSANNRTQEVVEAELHGLKIQMAEVFPLTKTAVSVEKYNVDMGRIDEEIASKANEQAIMTALSRKVDDSTMNLLKNDVASLERSMNNKVDDDSLRRLLERKADIVLVTHLQENKADAADVRALLAEKMNASECRKLLDDKVTAAELDSVRSALRESTSIIKGIKEETMSEVAKLNQRKTDLADTQSLTRRVDENAASLHHLTEVARQLTPLDEFREMVTQKADVAEVTRMNGDMARTASLLAEVSQEVEKRIPRVEFEHVEQSLVRLADHGKLTDKVQQLETSVSRLHSDVQARALDIEVRRSLDSKADSTRLKEVDNNLHLLEARIGERKADAAELALVKNAMSDVRTTISEVQHEMNQKASRTEVRSTMDFKADKADLSTLEARLSDLRGVVVTLEKDSDSHVTQNELHEVKEIMEKLAPRSDILAMQDQLRGKANTNELRELVSMLDGKAGKRETEQLLETLATKMVVTDLAHDLTRFQSSVESILHMKVNRSEFETACEERSLKSDTNKLVLSLNEMSRALEAVRSENMVGVKSIREDIDNQERACSNRHEDLLAVRKALDRKADVEDVNLSLESKADITAVNNLLESHTMQINAALDTKAPLVEFNRLQEDARPIRDHSGQIHSLLEGFGDMRGDIQANKATLKEIRADIGGLSVKVTQRADVADIRKISEILDSKANIHDVSELVTDVRSRQKGDKTEILEILAQKADERSILMDLSRKVDKTDLAEQMNEINANMAGKSAKVEVMAALKRKIDAQEFMQAITKLENHKADRNEVNVALQGKASTTEIQEKLSGKANLADIRSWVEATHSDLEHKLGNKADKNDLGVVVSELRNKADRQFVERLAVEKLDVRSFNHFQAEFKDMSRNFQRGIRDVLQSQSELSMQPPELSGAATSFTREASHMSSSANMNTSGVMGSPQQAEVVSSGRSPSPQRYLRSSRGAAAEDIMRRYRANTTPSSVKK